MSYGKVMCRLFLHNTHNGFPFYSPSLFGGLVVMPCHPLPLWGYLPIESSNVISYLQLIRLFSEYSLHKVIRLCYVNVDKSAMRHGIDAVRYIPHTWSRRNYTL